MKHRRTQVRTVAILGAGFVLLTVCIVVFTSFTTSSLNTPPLSSAVDQPALEALERENSELRARLAVEKQKQHGNDGEAGVVGEDEAMRLAKASRELEMKAAELGQKFMQAQHELEEKEKELEEAEARCKEEIGDAASAVGPSTGQQRPILGSEDDLLLSEIEMPDPVDLHDPALEAMRAFELYHTPSEDWVTKAAEVVDAHGDVLASAHNHVHDPRRRVTVVTSLLDLGRDKLEKVGQFKRSFSEYIQRFQRTVNIDFPMVVFMDAKHVSEVDWSQHTQGLVVIPTSVDQLEKRFQHYHDRIEQIRNSPLYKKQAKQTGWLQFAPQAALKHYNLLVMSKIFFLHWAAQLNPHRTQYLMFVDAGHDCVGALRTTHMNMMRKLMGRMMVSYFDYHTGQYGETHGMSQMAFQKYLGPPYSDDDAWGKRMGCCKVVRGGIFGGTPGYIEVVAKAYNLLLSQTLSDGYMGTEENLFAILLYRFPSLFNAYHNHDGDNCRLFVDASEKAEPDNDLYHHGDQVDQWDSGKRQFAVESGTSSQLVTTRSRLRG